MLGWIGVFKSLAAARGVVWASAIADMISAQCALCGARWLIDRLLGLFGCQTRSHVAGYDALLCCAAECSDDSYAAACGAQIRLACKTSKALESFVIFFAGARHPCRRFLQSTLRVPRLQKKWLRIIWAAPAKRCRTHRSLAYEVTDR